MYQYMRTTKRDRENRVWYGVAALENGRVAERVDELTTDAHAVGELVKRMNRGNVSLIHFPDVIEDFMAQLSYL